MLTIYTYANCDRCRAATRWLRERGVAFAERPIREIPPSLQELRAMRAALGGELHRLFNTSGRDYREMDLKCRLPNMSEDEAFALLAGNGNLVKRPFVLGPGVAWVGFDAAVWGAALRSA
jgi:arsenate reductase